MYVILALVALLIIGVSCLTAYLVTAARRARKREAVAERLNAVAAQAEQEHKERKATAKASAALTAVLPAIKQADEGPRSVA
jgi:Sec-independent protein translocase protein TatA